VIVIVDGLRSDAQTSMPYSDELWARGVSAALRLSPPAYASASWRVILTGATPELLGVPLFPDPDWSGPSLPAVSLLNLNIAAGRGCAMALHAEWQSLVPGDACSARLFVSGADATADQQVADGAVDMERGQPALLIVHFNHLAAAGETYGTADPRYLQAAQAVDGMIRQVVEPALTAGATVVVLSSHGLSREGNTIGADPSITQVPFFLVGPGVIPGSYNTIEGRDIAPTLAALVGLPAPPLAQGQVRYDMLSGDMLWQTGRHLRMGVQRLNLARRYLANWESDGQQISTLPEMITQGGQSFQAGDAEAAWQTANTVMQAADGAMRVEQAAQLRRVRLPRLILALILWVVILLIWLAWQRRRIPVVGVAALIGLLSEQVIFWLGGGRYSLASMPEVTGFLAFTLWQAAIGVVIALLALVAWRLWQRAHEHPSLASDLLGAAWGMAVIWALPALIGYWQQGVTTSWQMLDVTLLFWQLWGLTQLWAIPLFAIPAAWLAAGVAAILARRTGYDSEWNQSELPTN
jgi:hypothetical protein